jgi:calpain
MEKAYSKLHGCYENICDGTILEGLVDLTGGVSEGWQLNDPETSKLIENNQLWQMMMSYFHQ